MAAHTVEVKNCSNPCPVCGGAMYLRADVSALGALERLHINCLKCGPIQTLSSISPDDARIAAEETYKRIANVA